MSFPRYPKYKDSGVEWLGKVPEGWVVSRLGFESWVRARLGWKGLKAEEYVDDGFAFLSTPNIKGAVIDFENVNFITPERYEESPEIKVREGDVLLTKDGSTLGTVSVVRKLPRPTTVNSSIAVITPNESLNGLFLFYLFSSSYIEQTIQRVKGGMGVPHLFQSDLNKFYIPVPSLGEQVRIAEFLDSEIATIDSLIVEQQRLMELLKEKRQAVISHAVTKGLNPNAPMKPSGIEWLGDVPAHWDVKRLKNTVKSIDQGWSPQCEGYPASDDEWGVLKVGCVNGGTFNPDENKLLPIELQPVPELSVQHDDLLISRANTRELVGSAAVAERDYPKLMICDKLYRLRFIADVCFPQFISYYLGSSIIREQLELDASGASASMLNIGQSAIMELAIGIPSFDEQAQIVAGLEEQISKLDLLTNEARRAIELLQERRTALISAAVTGQVDVRGLSAATS